MAWRKKQRMIKRIVPILCLCITLTGCSSIIGVETVDIDKEYQRQTTSQVQSSVETLEARETQETSESSGEGLIYSEEYETEKSLGNISVDDGMSIDNDSLGVLKAPTRATTAAPTTAAPTTTAPQETYAVATLAPSTTAAYVTAAETTVAETTRDYGETPTKYYSEFGVAVRRTNVSVPDVGGISKDSYGNYIVPFSIYGVSNSPITNERGKIPYVFYYDSLGNILNPFPDDLNKYSNYYELGNYVDSDGKKHLLPITDIK